MSAKTKEKYWMEFKVLSEISGIKKEVVDFKIDDGDLNIVDSSRKRNLNFIMRNENASKLFKKKLPIYIKDAIAHVYQEIDIESNPYWNKIIFDEEMDKLLPELRKELGSKPPKPKTKKKDDGKKIISKEEYNFYEELYKKTSISELDKSIIQHEDKLDDLVYLFDKQTILKNSIFFNLFKHWFDHPIQSSKIDGLIGALKRKAGVQPGPKSFSEIEIKKLVIRYEYLRRIFKKVKKIIEIPKRSFIDEKTDKEWRKLESYLKKNKYFKINNCFATEREKRKGYRPLEYLGDDRFRNNINDFQNFFLFDTTEDEAKSEIEIYKRGKISNTQMMTIEREARLIFLEMIGPKLGKKTYYRLEVDIKASDYSLAFLYKKHSLEKIDSQENIEKKINKIKEALIKKIIQAISDEPYRRREILKALKKHKPSELAIFLLSKIYNTSQRRIGRVRDENKAFLDKSSAILSRYPHLK